MRELDYHLWRAICTGEASFPDKYIYKINELIMLDLFRELTEAEQDNAIAYILYNLDKKQKEKSNKAKGSTAGNADKTTRGGGLTRVK